jgi:hypothetical protein
MAEPYHSENIAMVLEHAMQLAERAGNESNAERRAELIARCMFAWRCAHLKRWPVRESRA